MTSRHCALEVGVMLAHQLCLNLGLRYSVSLGLVESFMSLLLLQMVSILSDVACSSESAIEGRFSGLSLRARHASFDVGSKSSLLSVLVPCQVSRAIGSLVESEQAFSPLLRVFRAERPRKLSHILK